MVVRILFGSPPSPPPVLSAEVLRGLRAPDGSRPCRVGLDKALRWIGDREIPIEQALEEAKSALSSDDLEWGRRALGISGYGSGYGSDYGHGHGHGYGYGHGSGYGDGHGCGESYGSDYGSGYGYGHGSRYGDGCGDGFGFGGYGEGI